MANPDGTPSSALEAINAVLGPEEDDANPSSEDQGADEGVVADGSDTSSEEDGADASEGAGEDDSSDGEGEGDVGKGEGAGEEPASDRNPDGTFKKRADGKDEKGAKPGEQKKEPDALNDPIPKDLKPATQDRMRTLIKTAKEAATERDRVRTDFDYMVNGIQATGTSPEQYGETLSWLAMFNSGDPTQQEKALELAENVCDRLATLLGKERVVGDPLKDHADLREAVAKGQVTAQYAKEIARTRNSSGMRQQLNTVATTEQQQRQAAQQELATARTDLSALEATLKTTDPQYEAKKALLVPILRPVFKTMPPGQWKGAFEQAYAKVKVPAVTTVNGQGSKRSVPGNQPMRAGKNPAGGQARAAGSALDAVNEALAGMK